MYDERGIRRVAMPASAGHLRFLGLRVSAFTRAHTSGNATIAPYRHRWGPP